MRHTLIKSSVLLGLSVVVAACNSTAPEAVTAEPTANVSQFARVIKPEAPQATQINDNITLEQIMADPKWLGRQPQSPGFGLDGSVVYSRKQEDTQLYDVFRINEQGESVKVAPEELHKYKSDEKATSRDGQYTAWKYEDSVFVQMPDGEIVRVTYGQSLSNG